MKDIPQGHGFIPESVEPDQYVFGASTLPRVVLQPTGQWTDFLPPDEPQSREHLETCNCTAYGTLNAVEILIRRLYGTQPNFSERFVGINAGTRPPGNSPQKACEAIRKYGLVEEALLPFTDVSSVLEYYSPDPLTSTLLARGREFLKAFDFGHEWVFTGPETDKKDRLKEALKYSPVALSVYAWTWDSNGVYFKMPGVDDNHWAVCYSYEEGKYWEIFDTYPPFRKKVAWDTDFMQAKRFHLEKKEFVAEAEVEEKKLSLIERLVRLLTQYVPLVIQELTNRRDMNPTILQFCKAIQEYEGWFPPSKQHPQGSRSFRNKNPGNLKYVGQKEATGKDDKGFCIFPTEEIGFAALIRLVERAKEGKSVHYKPDMTIDKFVAVYAPSADNNHPQTYAAFIGRKLGVDPAVFTIKNLS